MAPNPAASVLHREPLRLLAKGLQDPYPVAPWPQTLNWVMVRGATAHAVMHHCSQGWTWKLASRRNMAPWSHFLHLCKCHANVGSCRLLPRCQLTGFLSMFGTEESSVAEIRERWHGSLRARSKPLKGWCILLLFGWAALLPAPQHATGVCIDMGWEALCPHDRFHQDRLKKRTWSYMFAADALGDALMRLLGTYQLWRLGLPTR